MKTSLIIAGLLFGVNSFAAVSPYYDSLEKIQAVLAVYPLSQATAGPITSIKHVEGLIYEVTAGNCVASVTLKAEAPNGPGKTTYSVEAITQPACH
ncbi:MAG: hypothetical protein AB7G93_20355 [Bdellovibrionales bacterium]